MVGRDYGDHVSGAELDGGPAIEPFPVQLARAPVERTQYSIPCAKNDVTAIDNRSGLAIVLDAVEMPQQAMAIHIPCLERHVTTLVEDAVTHHSIGDIRTLSLALPLLLARLLVEPYEPLVAGGQDDRLVAHGRTREEHAVGLVLPTQFSRLLVDGFAIAQRVAVIQVFLIYPNASENRRIIGHNAAKVKAGGNSVVLLGQLGCIIVQVDAIGEHHNGGLTDYLVINRYPLTVQVDVHQGVAKVPVAHVQCPHHHAVDAVGLI